MNAPSLVQHVLPTTRLGSRPCFSHPEQRMWRASFVIRALAATVASASTASAQAELQGHVYGAERQALANADVSVPELQRRTLTDSLGRFRLQGILPGTHLVITRSIGFR